MSTWWALGEHSVSTRWALGEQSVSNQSAIAEQIAEHRIGTEQAQKDAEQDEIEFLREFRENWQKQKADQPDSLSKPDLFKAVQDANKALGQNKPNSTLLKGLRDILEDDSKPKS